MSKDDETMNLRSITICKERYYPRPPEDVWTAITDAHALAEWFEPNNHVPVAGRKFQFQCDAGVCGDSVTECEVLEAEAPRRLVWSWIVVPRDKKRPPSKPMTIAWTLAPKDEGTTLVLEHSNAENVSWLTRNMMRVGWGFMMKKLIPKVLNNVEAGGFTPGAIPLNKRGYKCETVPPEYIR
jgi:uncharacterized protein YndB with AHSA1/START domain